MSNTKGIGEFYFGQERRKKEPHGSTDTATESDENSPKGPFFLAETS
jgi:hypothetical protein